MVFYIKEDRKLFNSIKHTPFVFKKDGTNFIVLCILGSLITFIKFSNSGSVGTLHLQTLAKYSGQDTSVYEGYLSVMFSLFQLFGSVLVGFYLIQRYNKNTIFVGGCCI